MRRLRVHPAWCYEGQRCEVMRYYALSSCFIHALDARYLSPCSYIMVRDKTWRLYLKIKHQCLPVAPKSLCPSRVMLQAKWTLLLSSVHQSSFKVTVTHGEPSADVQRRLEPLFKCSVFLLVVSDSERLSCCKFVNITRPSGLCYWGGSAG